METKILNYRIIVEPDLRTGSKQRCFTAYCPTLGIADSGDTVEEALANIKVGIEVWIEALAEDNEEVPADRVAGSMVTFTAIEAPMDVHVAYQ